MPKGIDGPPVSRFSQTDAAYIAGLIDGEGCVCVRLHGEYLATMLSVSMIHKPTIQWLRETVGSGNVVILARNGNFRRAWKWSLGGHKAADVLRQTIPYMKTKKNEAVLYVQLMDMRAAMNGASRARGRMRGTKMVAKYTLAPDEHQRIVGEIKAEKKREYA